MGLTLKITDLGFSKIVGKEEFTTSFCGTLDYMAPEVKKSQLYNHKVDVYSVGVIYFELLAGDLPKKYNYHKPVVVNQKFTA